MILQLKAKHFEGTEYYDCQNCAISKALKEIFPNSEIEEKVLHVVIDGTEYNHWDYFDEEFDDDAARAASLGYDETVIREINIEGL